MSLAWSVAGSISFISMTTQTCECRNLTAVSCYIIHCIDPMLPKGEAAAVSAICRGKAVNLSLQLPSTKINEIIM